MSENVRFPMHAQATADGTFDAASEIRRLFGAQARLFAGGPVVLYITGPAPLFPLIWASENFAEVTGYRPEEVRRERNFWVSRIHPDDADGTVAAMAALGRGSESIALEYRWRFGDGTLHWVQHQVGTLHLGLTGGPLIGGLFLVIDERRNAVATAVESTQWLKATFDATPAAIVGVDLRGRVVSWNRAAEDLFGWRSDEVLGMPLPIVPDDKLDEFAQNVEIGSREPLLRVQTERLRRDGSRLKITLSTAPLRDASGNGVGVLGVLTDLSGQLRAEQEIRLHTALLAAVGESVVAIDNDGRIVYWNHGAEQLLGWTAAEALGLRATSLIAAEPDLSLVGQIVGSVVEGASWSGTLSLAHRSGATFPAQVSFRPHYDESGAIAGAVAVAIDVSERLEGEEAIRRSEARFRQQFDVSPIPTFLWRREGERIVFDEFNGAAGELTRGRIGEIVGRSSIDLYGENSQIHRDLTECFRTRQTIRRELTHTLATTGEPKELFVTYSAIEPDLVMVHTFDVTERRRTENALRQTNETLSAIFAASPASIVALDEHGRVEAWNPAAERMFGWSASEVIGTRVPVLPDEFHSQLPRLLTRLVSGEQIRDVAMRRRRKDGQMLDLSISVAPLYDRDGQISGVVTVGEDITARVSAESELRRRERQQSAVAALGQQALRGTDVQALFESACAFVSEGLGCQYAKVFEVRPGRQLVFRAVSGWSSELVGKDASGTLDEPMARYTLATETAVFSDDRSAERRFGKSRLAEAYRIASSMSVVMHGGEIAWGILQADSSSPRHFTQHDQSFLQGVANVLGAAVARKRAEEEIAEKEARLRLLVEQMPAVVWSVDRSLRITYVTGSGLAIFGARGEDFIGINLADLVRSSGVDARTIAAHESALAGESVSFEVTWGPRTLDVHLEPFRGLEGLPTGAVGLAIDSTDRKSTASELHRSREQFRALSARVLSSLEEERTRIAREIHDELGQALTALKFDLAWLDQRVPPPDERRGRVQEMRELLDATIVSVRRIARELRPPLLEHLGLVAAVKAETEDFGRRTGVETRVVTTFSGETDHEQSTALFRIVQEALTNVARHSGAARVEIRLQRHDGRISLEIEDDGRGIELAAVSATGSLGLLGMRERARALGGELNVRRAGRRGTIVRAVIPLRACEEGEK
jgi:two-component system, NarL family, sensor histidine kinase UhpB